MKLIETISTVHSQQEKEDIMKQTIKTILVAMAVTFGTISAQASPKSDFIVQTLPTSPEFAQNTSQDLLLHNAVNGATYLYVEQEQGSVLSIFDVTDPAHMKLATSVHTEARGSYDFISPVGGNAELIAFRDGSGTAILDLRKIKSPRLTSIAASVPTEMLGTAGYLSLRQPATPTASAHLQDIQLVETNQSPRLVTTIANVTKQVTRPETGTIFLLGKGKITVIRRIDSEQDYAVQQIASTN
jgi:hypothetical protein